MISIYNAEDKEYNHGKTSRDKKAFILFTHISGVAAAIINLATSFGRDSYTE